MTASERLFSRPSTLTDAERDAARRAYDADPTSLDAAICAALRTCEPVERIAEEVLGRVRCAS